MAAGATRAPGRAARATPADAMNAVATVFESHRRRLFGIAYRMLGSTHEAEDMVQETYLRWSAEPRADVRSDAAYLTTVITRLCLDQLKSARVQRTDYVGPWLPEPLPTETPCDATGGVDAESLSLAFLVLLESLTPLERATYLLHEVFEYSHAEVARILGIRETHARQLLHRSRTHVAQRRPRFAPSQDAHRRLLEAFARASSDGDIEGLKNVLAADAIAWSDGGGKVGAARKPIHGAARIAKFYAVLGRNAPTGTRSRIVLLNGWPALAIFTGDALRVVLDLETDGERIHAVRAIVNPDKLAHLTSL
jgi:RNA polymerase sigma-70 factor (ECF subfamily)